MCSSLQTASARVVTLPVSVANFCAWYRKVTCRLSTLVGTAIRMASMQKLGIQEACTAAHSLTALTAHLESVMLGDVKTASKP